MKTLLSIQNPQSKKHTMNNHIQRLQIFMMLIISIIFLYFLIGSNLHAKWGLIDDHAIIKIIGPELKLGLPQYFGQLYQNIVGTYGIFIRQVPIYLVIRTTEAFFWGNNPFLWYLFRFIFIVFSFFIIWIVVKRYIGFLYGFIFIAYILSEKYWSGILTRLGTHEIYSVPGIALYVWGYSNLLRVTKPSVFNWFLVLLGTIIAAGSKENFVILIIPSTILVLYKYYHKKMILSEFILYMLNFVFVGWISFGVFLVLRKVGHDVYANNISPMYRATLLLKGFIMATKLTYVILVSGIMFGINVTVYFFNSRKFKPIFRNSVLTLLIVGLLCLLYGSQYAFYAGNWPTGMRYDFPGLLVAPLSWLIVSMFFKKTLTYLSKNSIIIHIPLLICTIGFCVFIIQSKYVDIRSASQANAKETQIFSNKIGQILAYSSNNPSHPIIFDSFSVWDYESIASVNTYLENLGSKNKKYLKINNYPNKNVSDIAKILNQELENISKDGSPQNGWNLRPIGELKDFNNCIAIGFLQQPIVDCKYKIQIP